MMIIRASELTYRVSIMDGDGRRIDLPIHRIDTETGIADYYIQDGAGRYCFFESEVESAKVRLKTPIRFIGADGIDMTDLVVASLGE